MEAQDVPTCNSMKGRVITMAASLFSIPEPKPFDQLLSLKGKTAIVTGGGRGIGKQVVRRFAEAGANVVFCARHADQLDAVKREFESLGLPGALLPVTADVSSSADRLKLIDAAKAEFGGIDILVNCAAIYPPGPAMGVTEKVWDDMHDIDTKGAFFLSQSAAAEMISQGRGGRIINFLSTAFMNAAPAFAAYAIAKAGLWEATRVMSKELAPHRITVNAVTPGATLTEEKAAALASGNIPDDLGVDVGEDLQEHLSHLAESGGVASMMKQMIPMGRPGLPDDLAKSVLFLASDMGEYVTGQNIETCGGQKDNSAIDLSGIGAGAQPQSAAPEQAAVDPSDSTEPDSGLDGMYTATVNTPMGAQQIEIDLKTDGTALSGTMVFMGKKLDIQEGVATQAGFSYKIVVKAMLKKMEAKVHGTREGDAIKGAVQSPMGTFDLEGKRVG